MGSVLFVTATSTGVGKTFASVILLKNLQARGVRAGYFKPVMTGAQPQDADSDTAVVQRLALPHVNVTEMVGQTFREPASPHFAAALEGKRIDVGRMVERIHQLREEHDCLVVEGAGGLAVPLDEEGALLSDLVVQIGAPILLVASTALGTINHSLLTVEHARARRIPVAGILFNGMTDTPREQDSIRTIVKLARVPLVGVIPQLAGEQELLHACPRLEGVEALFNASTPGGHA